MFGQNGRVKDFGKSTLHKKNEKKIGRYGIDFFPELWKLTKDLQQPTQVDLVKKKC